MQAHLVFDKLARFAMVAGFAMLLVSCAFKPVIETDYDHTMDFSQYRTYGFFNPMGIENPNYSSIYGSIFRDAISKEMDSRGYVQSDNPDLMINVTGSLKDKTRVTTISDPSWGGYYGYRGGPWGGYGWGTSTYVSSYTEGTVNIDLVDWDEKRMVWKGVAVDRVKENEANDETRAGIYADIQEMFSAYPFRAGQ